MIALLGGFIGKSPECGKPLLASENLRERRDSTPALQPPVPCLFLSVSVPDSELGSGIH